MDCREFRNKHVAFVDDLLPAVEMQAMQRHRAACPRCSHHDTAIRRSLLLVRNLPPIQPSADFMARLNDRLTRVDSLPRAETVWPRPTVTTLAMLAAGVAAVAYMAVETSRYFAPATGTRPALATASVPMLEPPSVPMANPAFVASVPTGMPVWPAVFMAGQSPLHFASLEFPDEDAER